MICSSDSEDDDDETIPDAPYPPSKVQGGGGKGLTVPNGSAPR